MSLTDFCQFISASKFFKQVSAMPDCCESNNAHFHIVICSSSSISVSVAEVEESAFIDDFNKMFTLSNC